MVGDRVLRLRMVECWVFRCGAVFLSVASLACLWIAWCAARGRLAVPVWEPIVTAAGTALAALWDVRCLRARRQEREVKGPR